MWKNGKQHHGWKIVHINVVNVSEQNKTKNYTSLIIKL